MDYKDKLKLAKEALDSGSYDKETIEYIFPELAESEDEKIRKKFIKLVKMSSEVGGFALHKWEADEMLAWLEKQGNKPQGKTALEAICEEKVDNANKVEQKFHEDDYIVNNISGDVFKVTEIKDDEYCIWPLDAEIMGYVRIVDVDNDYHLWTIQDAKDGDILICVKNNAPFIFKGCLDKFHPENPVAYCGIDDEGGFFVSINNGWWTDDDVCPATKEQRDTLFTKMKNFGYEWDDNKKELMKIEKQDESIKIKKGKNYLCTKTHKYAGVEWIEGVKYYSPEDYSLVNQGCTYYCTKYSKEEHNNLFKEVEYDGCVEKQGEPKWSEEDSKMLGTLIAIFEVNYPDEFYKVNPIGTTDMQGIHSSEIVKWIRTIKQRMEEQK